MDLYHGSHLVPAASTGAVAEMRYPFEQVRALGRAYRATWAPRQPGSTVLVREGSSTRFSPKTVLNCSVNERMDGFTAGYVWADDPTRPSYTPSAYWSYNSTLQRNTVTRTGVGAYTVEFPGLATATGNAQVTAFGTTSAICTIGGARWYRSGTATRLAVRCFAANGSPLDARFTASFTGGGGTANTYAFALSGNTAFQCNNSGGAISVVQLGGGRYNVIIPDTDGPRAVGTVKVTAVGDAPVTCAVAGWDPVDLALVVGVRCFTTTGQPVDQQFSVAYMDRMNVLGDNFLSEAYVWAHRPTEPDEYVPAPEYQGSRNYDLSGKVSITHPGPGVYDVRLPYQRGGFIGLDYPSFDGGNVQVTGYGTANARCQVGHWLDDEWEADRIVRVHCFTLAGQPADAMFTMQYTAQIQ